MRRGTLGNYVTRDMRCGEQHEIYVGVAYMRVLYNMAAGVKCAARKGDRVHLPSDILC